MKKTISVAILAVLLASLIVQPALAKPAVLKGQVTAIGSHSITVLTIKGESVVVTPPAGFDLASLAAGDTILAKGRFQEKGTFIAEWIKKLGQGAADDHKAEGSKQANAAFCNDDKKQEPHPLAVRLAEKYYVSTDWAMEYYCKGFSMGAILLALKTNQISGADAGDLLAQRSGGKGWGAIWQEQHMIGSEKDVNPPPGQLKSWHPTDLEPISRLTNVNRVPFGDRQS